MPPLFSARPPAQTRRPASYPDTAHHQAHPDRRALLTGLVACSLAGSVAGCASWFTEDPRPSTLVWRLETTPGVNPDIAGRPSPIWVRVYQLRSIGVFSGAEFVSLFENDMDVLGAELLQRAEYVMTPHQVIDPQQDPVSLHEDTRYIGVCAAYHEIDRAFWRDTVAVTPLNEDYSLTVKLDRLALRLDLERD